MCRWPKTCCNCCVPGGTAPTRGCGCSLSHRDGSLPIHDVTAQKWYHTARADAGITKRGGIHTLRHCCATHTLEAGFDLHSLSQWLGHRHVSTTSRDLHLVRPDAPDGARRDPLKLLAALPAVVPPITTH